MPMMTMTDGAQTPEQILSRLTEAEISALLCQAMRDGTATVYDPKCVPAQALVVEQEQHDKPE